MARESFSMTPPLTPSDKDLEEVDCINFFDCNQDDFDRGNGMNNMHSELRNQSSFLFDCRGESHTEDKIGKNSYIESGALRNLLNFGKPFLPDYISKSPLHPDILSMKLSHCFMNIRKNIQKLEKDTRPFCGGKADLERTKNSPYELRKEVVDIFLSISLYISDLDLEEIEEFSHSLVEEIVEMLKFLGPVYLLPSYVANASSPLGNKCSSPAYHLLHLHLDVRWWVLALLHQLEFILEKEVNLQTFNISNNNEEFIKEVKINVQGENSQQSLFDSYICLLIWDILTLMKIQVSKGFVSEVTSFPPFPCTCSFELSVSLLHVVDWRHKLKMKKAFWALVNEKLQLLLKFSLESISDDFWSRQSVNDFKFPSTTFKDVKPFQIWWIFTSLAKIFQYDSEGTKLTHGRSDVDMLRKLIMLTVIGFGNKNNSEEELRLYMRCCHSLLNIWKGEKEVKQSGWVAALWDYFSKTMDSNFMIKGGSLEEFANQSKTPSSFLERIKYLTEASAIGKNENSWMIFLRIIITLVKQSDLEWKLLKGRLFSKFHSKKMGELAPTGIYNTTFLFLSLANSADLNLCSKLCDLLCDCSTQVIKKFSTVAFCLSTTVLFLVSKKCRIDYVADKIEKKIVSIHQECTASVDTYERREIGHSIVILCEGFQEVLQISTDLTLNQSKLFSSALNSFTSQSSSVEQKAVLACLELGLQKVVNATHDLHYLANGSGIDIVESIWCNFHGYIKSQLSSLTPHSSLGTICSLLVICSSRFYSSMISNVNIQEATGLFNYIMDGKDITCRMKIMFLQALLQERDSAEYIAKICENYDVKMINCLLLSLISEGASEEVILTSEAVFSTPKLRKVVPCPPACPFGALEMLVQNLALQFKEAETFQTRMKIREKAFSYVSSLDKSIIFVLKKVPLPSHVPQVFRLIGCIFSHAYCLFYIKGKLNCPIPSLISAMILPNSIYNPEKPLGPAMVEALVPILPKVLFCLASLGPSTDPYISRCLKDIFLNYVYRFPATAHPFMEALRSGDIPNVDEVKALLIEVLNVHFLSKRNCSLVHLQVVISLLLELIHKHQSEWAGVVGSLVLAPLLELLLYLEDLQTKRLASDLLRKLLQERDLVVDSRRSSSVEDVRKFVSCHLAWHSSRVFRILDVIAVMNADIIREALPGINDAIKRTEEKRGTGEDQILRKGYKSLLDRLTISNEDERF